MPAPNDVHVELITWVLRFKWCSMKFICRDPTILPVFKALASTFHTVEGSFRFTDSI